MQPDLFVGGMPLAEIVGYGSPIKWAAMVVLSLGWLILAPRINKDAIFVHTKREIWSGVYLCCGAIGLAAWLLLPMFWLGLAVFVVLVGGVLGAYTIHRNGLVDPSMKWLSAEWFANIRNPSGKGPESIETKLRLYAADGRAVILTDTDAQDQEIVHSYNLTQQFLYDVAWHRASEVDVKPAGDHARVRYVIDGVASERDPLPLQDSETIIQYIKSKAEVAKTDREERERDLATKKGRVKRGKISIDLAGSPIDMEVVTAVSSKGSQLRIRVIQEVVRTSLDTLGIEEADMKTLKKITKGTGILLVTGPPRSGLTSTLYSILSDQDAFTKRLVTLENNAAADLENITQHEYETPEEIPERLGTLVRHDPDVILVDNCPDPRTAQLIAEFAEEKLAIVGMHATDCYAALAKWAKLVGDIKQAIQPLQGIMSQMLLRQLCQSCKEPYQPDPKLLAKAGVSAGEVEAFYRPPTQKPVDKKGNPIPCQSCQDVGYHDRTGVFAVLPISDDLRKVIYGGAGLADIRKAARKLGARTLQTNAMRKVVAGETSVQEVVRATQESKPRGDAAKGTTSKKQD